MSCLALNNPYDAAAYLGVLRDDLRAALGSGLELHCGAPLPHACSLNSSISWLYAAVELTQLQLLALGATPDPILVYPVAFFEDGSPMGFFDGLQPMDFQAY